MIIYLVRHGETDWNRQNRLQGIEDIELNETGRIQSAACAKAFTDVPIDCILSSPLKRAAATADIISGILGVAPVIVEQGLTERDFGKLSGLTLEEREALLGRGEDPCMEPKAKLTVRFMDVLYQYIECGTYEEVLVVSHGASINAVLAHLTDGSIGTGKTILKNTCVNQLVCHGRKIDVSLYNLTPEEFLDRRR